jgi:hypothetical protein
VLIFNCSKAFAEFIEPKKAAPAPLVGEAPSPHPSEDLPFLIDTDGQRPRHVQQWLVHLVRIRRRPCILAMDIATRYAMVFTGIARGDASAFINAFCTRLINEMAFAAQEVGMMADFEAMLTQFLERHTRFQFVLRMERSTLAHLKDAVWNFEYRCDEGGRLSEGHEECAVFDRQINDTLRHVKGQKDYFEPSTEMLCGWLRDFAGLTAQGETTVRARILERHRRSFTEFQPPPNTA